MKSKISLLLSGKLGYKLLVYLFDFCSIELIATDKGSIEIINFAKKKNILLFVGNPRGGKLAPYLRNVDKSILLSINYLFLIEKDIIENYEFPINFHGSLLPKYRGRTPHVWAIINNETETGVTAHFIAEECDSGCVILQKKILITEYDTGSMILEKYFDLYPTLVSEVIIKINSKKYTKITQNESLATFFPKRTPEDGRINWNWQRERIRNWVRAQAFPYPGAFTLFNDEKIIIDKISYSNLGFNSKTRNGTIIYMDPFPIVKTPNGCLRLEVIRINSTKLVKNDLLS